MRTAVAMEQLRKYVSAERNTSNNRRTVLSVQSVPRGYEKSEADNLHLLSF
jgi:hypothetical protein